MNKNICYVRDKINRELLEKELKSIMGKHDFSAFRSSRCSAKNSIKEITEDMEKDVHYSFDSEDIYLNEKEFQLLNDSLNHILRNSLDHGIEDYTSREKAKKDNKQKEISSDTFIEFIAMDIRLS